MVKFTRNETTVAPTVEVVSRDDAKAFLRITSADEDTLIDSLTVAARSFLEGWSGRSFVEQTREASMSTAPTGELIWLPCPKIRTVESVKYLDSDLAEQTLAASSYNTVLGDSGGIYFRDLPTIGEHPEAIVVEYKAGYGTLAADVPTEIQHAIKLLLADFYERRQPTEEIPEWIFGVMAMHKTYSV